MFTKGLNLKKIEMSDDVDSEIIKTISNTEYKVFLLKFIVSCSLILSGIILVVFGVTSESVISFSFQTANLELNNALPGVTLSIFGAVLMLFSRLNIKIK